MRKPWITLVWFLLFLIAVAQTQAHAEMIQGKTEIELDHPILADQTAWRTDGLFSSDLQINAGPETEIGSVTIETNGGVVALWGSSTIHLPADANITALIRIRKDSLTGPVLGVVYLAIGVGLPSNLLMTVTAIGTDMTPATIQTYKLTAENQRGIELFGNLFRRLFAINLK